MTEKVEKVEEIPTKKACTQPEIPLEVLLQDPDNQLLDIPINDDVRTCQMYRLIKERQIKRRIGAGLKEKKHFSKRTQSD